MSEREPFSDEQVWIGPIRAVEVYTSPPPGDEPVADALDTREVPFEEIKHLVADKPLRRASFGEPGRTR